MVRIKIDSQFARYRSSRKRAYPGFPGRFAAMGIQAAGVIGSAQPG
jgi:hypothetical protein